MHPRQPGLAACGGKDRSLEILRIFGGEEEDENDIFNSWVIRRLWSAKNVRSDEYGEAPIWISDIRFLDPVSNPEEGYRLATATRFGEIHIYYTLISKRPIYNVRVSNHPLTAIWPLPSHEHDSSPVHDRALLWSDTQDKVGKFSTISGKVTKEFKCPPGAALELHCFLARSEAEEAASTTASTPTQEKSTSVYATGGLDGKLRVYDLETGTLVAISSIMSKISSLWILDNILRREPISKSVQSGASTSERLVRSISSVDSESGKRDDSTRKRVRV
jgi:WD40 repeat protein